MQTALVSGNGRRTGGFGGSILAVLSNLGLTGRANIGEMFAKILFRLKDERPGP